MKNSKSPQNAKCSFVGRANSMHLLKTKFLLCLRVTFFRLVNGRNKLSSWLRFLVTMLLPNLAGNPKAKVVMIMTRSMVNTNWVMGLL
ncbi:MAG: hypothetical protein ACI9SQ_002256 [Rubritalea sp.]|jgi:hypothetical protein